MSGCLPHKNRRNTKDYNTLSADWRNKVDKHKKALEQSMYKQHETD